MRKEEESIAYSGSMCKASDIIESKVHLKDPEIVNHDYGIWREVKRGKK